jgi:hypothetical protein
MITNVNTTRNKGTGGHVWWFHAEIMDNLSAFKTNIYQQNAALPTYANFSGFLSTCVSPTNIVIEAENAQGIANWAASSSQGGYVGTQYYHDGNTGKGTKTLRFTPAIARSGTYEVFAIHTAFSNRATNVPFKVAHRGGLTTKTINQQGNHGKWVSLGTYDFEAGGNYYVELSNSGTSGYVVADAIRFTFKTCKTFSCTAPAATEKIVDNTAAAFSGAWTSGANAGYYGSNYMHDNNTDKGTKTATFTPNLDQSGAYEVFIWYVSAANRATNAKVEITQSNGSAVTTYVNQQLNGSAWVSLGTYNLGTDTKAVLQNEGTNGFVMADAFRWVYRGCATASARTETLEEANELPHEWAVYPNPFEQYIQIHWNVATTGKVSLAVSDVLGRKMIEQSYESNDVSNTISIDTHRWLSGIYVVSLQDENGILATKKIVKK